jgi:hypothetical protein
VTLVPDRRLDGTNVLGLPADAGFRVTYGPGQRSPATGPRPPASGWWPGS